MAAQVGGIAHLYNRMEQIIADYQTAAYAVQALSICSIVGRFWWLAGFSNSHPSLRPWQCVFTSLGLTCIAHGT